MWQPEFTDKTLSRKTGAVQFSDNGIVTVACIPSAARIRLVDTSAGNVYSSVHNREADFGLSFISSGESDLNFIPLVDETYQLICRREHPFAQRLFLGWKEFFNSDYIWLNKSSGNRHLLDQALGRITLRRTPVCETQHVTTMIGMVEAGLGIAAVPSMIFPGSAHPELVKINLVEPVVKRQVGLIRKMGSELSPLALELEKIITGLFLP
ncbi:hypothetical protein NWH84_004641 [Salmonella enterica]|nr:hypothetical protein [Salmonella enterica subsp. diarizonae serovar 53:r:z35]EJS8541261.1 hypothetical protein [Salmonella enterica]EJS8567114.1 hypothetical protein [Salmonella enterica]EJS8571968.1 hypothetical protein [Salmonella enterica]